MLVFGGDHHFIKQFDEIDVVFLGEFITMQNSISVKEEQIYNPISPDK
jgi:hypothetical protein